MPFSSDPAARGAGAALGLFPELGAAGGIQRASQHIAAVLAKWTLKKGWGSSFLSLNDPAGEYEAEVNGCTFAYRGFARSKARFLRASAMQRRQTRLIMAAHPHLAPVAWAAKRGTRAKSIVVVWGVEVWNPLPAYRRWTLRRADAVLAISQDTAEQVSRKQGVDPARVRLLPLALDPTFWQRAQEPAAGLPPAFPKGQVLLSVTRLASVDSYKGVDTVIEALPQLSAAVPNVQYVVVGDGDDRPRLESLARNLGVAGRVHFLGRLDSRSGELAACYAACDAFVLPSKGEGFGLVFLEAMAFGKPVIGGAHGGTPDVIDHGESGFLVPHGDCGRLAALLLDLLTNDARRREMGERARQRVQQKFLFGHFESRLAGILEEVCAS